MKYIAEHFGPALVAMAILISLAVLIVGLLAADGTISTEFVSSVTSFFSRMHDATGI